MKNSTLKNQQQVLSPAQTGSEVIATQASLVSTHSPAISPVPLGIDTEVAEDLKIKPLPTEFRAAAAGKETSKHSVPTYLAHTAWKVSFTSI